MRGFNKIILSRKGFDSSNGGDFSPFDIETGRYIVLPIPNGKIGSSYPGNRIIYEDIKIKPDYISGIDAKNLRELVCHESIRYVQKARDAISRKYAHFDPWLGHCPWLREDSDHRLGAFGQVGSPQGVLKKHHVGKGSLFLFFSRFKPVNGNKGSKFNDIDVSREHLEKGVAFIYGWLKVGEVIEKYDDIHSKLSEIDAREVVQRHPHATREYFDDSSRTYKNNTIYIAEKYLFDHSKRYSGCGYFPKLSGNLLLTATESAQKPFHHWLPSLWKMPPGLSRRTCLIYLNDWLDDNLMRHKTYGQEFVFDSSEEFYQWFNDKLLSEI